MTTSPRSRSTLRAGRIRQQVLVRRSHPDPERVRLQLHAALSSHLPDALREAFGPVDAPNDDVVWRIRRLTLDVSVNTRWDDRRLARAWAMRLARAVHRAIETGGDGISVVRFDDRAAYVASFLREIADGTAWTRWWFDGFVGLKLLSRTATIRTALLREPDVGVRALAAMPSAAAGLVAGQLSLTDARTVLDALAPALADDDVDAAATIVVDAYRRLASPAARGDDERWVFRIFAESLRTTPGRVPRAVVEIGRAMVALSRVIDMSGGRIVIVRRLLTEGNVAALHLVLSGDDAERVAPLARLRPDRLDAIIEALEEPATRAAAADEPRTIHVEWMPVAGPLLLAPFVAALPLEEITSDWPKIGDAGTPAIRRASAAALVRLFIMATACGGERAARVLADPTTRLLAGVGSAVSTAAFRDWLTALGAHHALQLERSLADWRIAEHSIATDTWLMARAHAERAILLDCSRGHWLIIRDDAPSTMGDIGEWFARSRRVCAEQELAELDALVRADRLTAEIEWLELPASIGVPLQFELALAVAAQGVLRDLAWRLPGFARASLPHLWTNFLAIDAHVEHEPERIAAVLAKPPLSAVMSMTGMMRATYRLPWCSRTIALFPGDGR